MDVVRPLTRGPQGYRSVLELVRVWHRRTFLHAHRRKCGHDDQPDAHHWYSAAVLLLWRLLPARLLDWRGYCAACGLGVSAVWLWGVRAIAQLRGASARPDSFTNCALRHSMARMAWFKKERKPRTSERVKLEIPADAWEKCDQCGHVDIRERFVRALNVCPNCGFHRRITAQEYIDLLVDEGSWHELFAALKSADPLKFENYADRVQAAIKKAGPLDAIRTGYARLHGMP